MNRIIAALALFAGAGLPATLLAAGPTTTVSAGLTDTPVTTTTLAEPGDPLDQLWPWASVSKQITAVIAMQEVERGKLKLDNTLAEVLPAFKGQTRDTITVRQLMMHTSGLPNPDDSPAGRRGPGDALGYCAGAPKAAAGGRFEYNYCDTIVLAAVLERVTRTPFPKLLQQRIAKPLGLKTLALDGKVARKRFSATSTDNSNFGASGAMGGSLRDLLTFDRALMQGKLLSPASLAVLWQGEPKLGYVALGAWSFPMQLPGCEGEVALVERRGHIDNVQVRNVLAPQLGRAVILVSDDPAVEYGEIWMGAGVTFEAVTKAFCQAK